MARRTHTRRVGCAPRARKSRLNLAMLIATIAGNETTIIAAFSTSNEDAITTEWLANIVCGEVA